MLSRCGALIEPTTLHPNHKFSMQKISSLPFSGQLRCICRHGPILVCSPHLPRTVAASCRDIPKPSSRRSPQGGVIQVL